MKMSRFVSVLSLIFVLLMLLGSLPVSAKSAYQTYTYSILGETLYSPDAYTAVKNMNYSDMGLDKDFSNPSDMVVDDKNNVYIVDCGNNRIVVLDQYLKRKFIISEFINEQGQKDSFDAPEGVFVSSDRIWVCDTGNARIVVFDRDGKFVREFWQPESQLFEDDAVYKPVAIAVDKYNRVYVVSSTTYEGIIMMTEEGQFYGFIGAQATTISAWDLFWRRFQTAEQKAQSSTKVSTEYSNVSISPSGFLYATIALTDDLKTEIEGMINSGSGSGLYSPVKMLNSAGNEIMRRNGFWPPVGEIDYNATPTDGGAKLGVSRLIDVAVGPENTWTTIDEIRNRSYTYDYNGNLLFAFGDDSSMLGGISNIEAVAYMGKDLLFLDKGTTNSITVYKRTDYGDMIIAALHAENNMDYDYAVTCWKEVLKRNSNYDSAYVGIGNSLYRDGEYKEALAYYEAAYDTSNWSVSWSEVRRDWMSKYFFVLILIIVVVIICWTKFLGYAKKVNKAAAINGKARKSFKEELLYGFHVIFHPFDGFYDLKHEHRGSVRASIVYLAVVAVTMFYSTFGAGYVMNPTRTYDSMFTQLMALLLPFFLFVLSNWCLTTLFEGEGSFKDIFIATSYSLLPLPILLIPATLISNYVTATEASLIGAVISVATFWMCLLIFFGTMTTHDYSLGKNVLTIGGTLVGMVIIMFLALLFTTLLSNVIGLVTNIITEIQFRV